MRTTFIFPGGVVGPLAPGRMPTKWRGFLQRGGSDEEALHRLDTVKREVVSAISRSHSVRVADLVLVQPGSIPITTSGKVRRSACMERYWQDEFSRLDVTA